jgi:hypothetical protein
LKIFFRYRLLIVFLSFYFIGCDNVSKIDANKFIANYERDKFILADTIQKHIAEIDNSDGWTISLKSENSFEFKGTNKIIIGLWTIDKNKGEDYSIKLSYNKDSTNCRINGNIIYFDRPEKLFDSLFNNVIFVKTTRKIE